MSEFTATTRHRSGSAIVDLRGDLDGRAEAQLDAALATVTETPVPTLVLNFSEVGYINSTGIALIVGVLAKARREAIAVRVCGLSDHYQHIFEITRLADFMAFFPDEETAIGDGMAAPA